MNKLLKTFLVLVIVFQILIFVCTAVMLEPIREYNSKFSGYDKEVEMKFCPYCGQEVEN